MTTLQPATHRSPPAGQYRPPRPSEAIVETSLEERTRGNETPTASPAVPITPRHRYSLHPKETH